jgi:bacterioferritin
MVIERILFLEGLLNLQGIDNLRIGEDVPEMLHCDLEVELDAIPDLQAGIAYCEVHKDYVTRDLFDEILKSEVEHVDWLETQLDLIDKMGEKNYLRSAK